MTPAPPITTSTSAVSPPSASLLQRLGLDWFLLALLAVVGLAYLQPGIGSKASAVPWGSITTGGVALIFFSYGLRLSPEKLRAGMRNWRLHAVVQLSTFVLFPLLALAVRPLFAGAPEDALWASIFFLCTLPSTVSTSVVMVSIAGGNMPAAIFNASISSLLGILLTPIWVSLVLHTGAADGNLGGLVLDLALQVLLPVVLGVLLHPRFGAWAEAHKAGLRVFDQIIILLMVFTSFCESFAQGVFRSYGWGEVLGLGAGMVALFLLVFGLITLVCRLLGFSAEDRIAAVFCGSKKSLVHGTVLAKVLFAGTVATGALLLPLMLYHALQIVLASSIAQAQGRRMAAAVSAAG
ncbi:bile acid:sodium symporter [Hymenobacter busanensis]|uniref:Bile acid:sodium symporter n=1 Tax=Hymenobacter busanensis TaxID=2607656 RepID=A0A7L4ZTF3_9BACT|nr:bile acid:sodium symporter family protein [Hymenobacter busanensis]KAA9327567.1 bile acid:sodium symporter [Hymenobacter busanensis]QHJ06095.1 bile acid:sodium symporter [Hymenobacter busanensis]